MKRWRGFALLLLCAGMCGALAACSGLTAAAATPTPLYPLLPTTASAPTITAVPITTLVATVTPTATTYAPPCQASQLRLSVAPQNGVAMGHTAVYFEFTNSELSADCSLRGFPSIHLLDQAGKSLPVKVTQAPQAYLWTSIPINTIELPAGGAAYFEVEVDTVPTSGYSCLNAAKTLIAPPQSDPGFGGFVSSTNLGSCDGVLDVSPVVARLADV